MKIIIIFSKKLKLSKKIKSCKQNILKEIENLFNFIFKKKKKEWN
jgi:hypothetical protein